MGRNQPLRDEWLLPVPVLGPCPNVAMGSEHGTVQCPALGVPRETAGPSEWDVQAGPGCCDSTEGFGEKQHKCSHRHNTLVTRIQGTDCAALILIPI